MNSKDVRIPVLFLDFDQCGMNNHTCDSNAMCINTDGSFACTCNEGYTGDGVYCGGKHARFSEYLYTL